MSAPQMQFSVPMTKTVKALIIANVSIWVVLVLIIQGFLVSGTPVFDYLALTPARVFNDFWIWQLGTYMFLHSHGVFHVLFNMLILWWFGSELEGRWGSKFFLQYFLTCGIGAGLIYTACTVIYTYATGNLVAITSPLVGASGATFGLLLAYGLIFGEREIYFMMLFPMKAKYFTAIIGAVELLTLLDSGFSSRVSNLAHLGGLVVGFVYLTVVARMRAGASGKDKRSVRRGRSLKLVVNNEQGESKSDDKKGPKYWN